MWLKKTFSSDFVKNVFTLVAGSAIAQAINFAFNIYLTRIYSPADFGTLSVFVSIAAFILVFSCGRYDVALVASKTDEEASKLFTLCFIILSIITIAIFPVAAIIYFFSIDLYKSNEAYNWFYYIPPFVFLVTGIQIFWMWFARQKKFKNISFIRVGETIILGVMSILLKNFYGFGLLIANILSQLSSFTVLSWLVFKKSTVRSFIHSKTELKKTAYDYIDFPKINIIQGFVDILQMNGIPLIMAGYLTSGSIGLYALCMRVLQAPMYLIVKPIATVFFSEASAKHRNKENLFHLTKKTIVNAGLITLPIPFILFIAGPFLFGFIFGPQWKEAGEYAKILSIWIFFDLVRQSVSQITSVLGRQKELLYYSVIGVIVFITTIYIGIDFKMETKDIFLLIAASQSLVSIGITLACLMMAKKTV